jgi:hypothetical protein
MSLRDTPRNGGKCWEPATKMQKTRWPSLWPLSLLECCNSHPRSWMVAAFRGEPAMSMLPCMPPCGKIDGYPVCETLRWRLHWACPAYVASLKLPCKTKGRDMHRAVFCRLAAMPAVQPSAALQVLTLPDGRPSKHTARQQTRQPDAAGAKVVSIAMITFGPIPGKRRKVVVDIHCNPAGS